MESFNLAGSILSKNKTSEQLTEPVNLAGLSSDSVSEKPVPSLARFYFPGLNQVRFLAAFSVIVHHIEQKRQLFGFSTEHFGNFTVNALGKEGVRLFFVLSGFLITFLLIQELNKNQTIDIMKFYGRRMLRIWPLYYLVVFNAFFCSPLFFHPPVGTELAQSFAQLHHNFWEKLGLFVFFLPNLCLIKFPRVQFGSHCWSLGVEEQFYLIWPCILLLSKRMLPVGIVMAVALKPIILFSMDHFVFQGHWHLNHGLINQLNAIYQMVSGFNVESFAAGAIAAYVLVKRPQLMQSISVHPISTIAIITGIVVGLSIDFPCRDLWNTATFVLLVLSLSHRSIDLGPLTPVVDYLGIVSYGLYMIHPTVINFVAQWLTATSWGRSSTEGIITLYVTTFALTILAATVSYSFFEKPFLKLKERLALIC